MVGINKSKKYLSIEELVALLEERGVKTDHDTAMILLYENYFRVVNGYKDLFLEADGEYKKGTHFNEIYAIFQFDRDLRALFLKRILMMENRLKSVLSNVFAKYGLKDYLVLENFLDAEEIEALQEGSSSKVVDKVVKVIDLISEINSTVSRQFKKRNKYITHYVRKYGNVPFWVLITALGFSDVSKFFAYMKKGDQNEVARTFLLHAPTLESFLRHMTLFRNASAHDEKFYSFKSHSKTMQSKDLDVYEKLNVEKDKDGNYMNGVDDIFSLVIIFKYFLVRDEFKELVQRLSNMFRELEEALSTISIKKIREEMGFPDNWFEIVNC